MMISRFSLSEKSESTDEPCEGNSNAAVQDAAADAYLQVPSTYVDFCLSLGAVAGKEYRLTAEILEFGGYPESAKELRRTAKDLENCWGLFEKKK